MKHTPTIQCIALKETLKKVGIKDISNPSGQPSVRTERIYEGTYDGKPMYRYGDAKCILHYYITKEQESLLKEDDPFIKIERLKNVEVTIIRS